MASVGRAALQPDGFFLDQGEVVAGLGSARGLCPCRSGTRVWSRGRRKTRVHRGSPKKSRAPVKGGAGTRTTRRSWLFPATVEPKPQRICCFPSRPVRSCRRGSSPAAKRGVDSHRLGRRIALTRPARKPHCRPWPSTSASPRHRAPREAPSCEPVSRIELQDAGSVDQIENVLRHESRTVDEVACRAEPAAQPLVVAVACHERVQRGISRS